MHDFSGQLTIFEACFFGILAPAGGYPLWPIFWSKNRGIMGYHFFEKVFNGPGPQIFWIQKFRVGPLKFFKTQRPSFSGVLLFLTAFQVLFSIGDLRLLIDEEKLQPPSVP